MVDNLMLTLKCAKCKRKLWKYEKIGKGEVIRLHKDRITKHYFDIDLKKLTMDEKLLCVCGQPLCHNKGSCMTLVKNGVLTTGSKVNKKRDCKSNCVTAELDMTSQTILKQNQESIEGPFPISDRHRPLF